MTLYLVDANLPRRVPLWSTDDFQFVSEIDDEWTDTQIWEYARENRLTIISKDADFSHRIIVSSPPPKVIHIRVGNLRLAGFVEFIIENWATIESVSAENKLVNVYYDRIEAIR